ncbi:hypothetical protein JOY44_29680 (plasmid) [Phormidium sp. CLA17]|uniref:hypothetical protein n=1 Tax=Leptolyngbya sp. Cla-17 TaxID=2803751 RepID=UPI00149186CC|nr:hypothetical protein [Leptolyngbya sp. Cla-17]MBM0745593.1 hypothetical protein [Leptolyngbya sp. Cla-17]
MQHSVLLSQFPNPLRRKIAIESSSPDSEVIDDIPDKRVVYRVLEHRLSQSATDERTAEIRAAVANHAIISWEHINLLGEYDFSDEKLRDSVGIPPPKNSLKAQAQKGERKPV